MIMLCLWYEAWELKIKSNDVFVFSILFYLCIPFSAVCYFRLIRINNLFTLLSAPCLITKYLFPDFLYISLSNKRNN